MKKYIVFCFLVALLPAAYAACTIPTENTEIMETAVFCPGIYNIENGIKIAILGFTEFLESVRANGNEAGIAFSSPEKMEAAIKKGTGEDKSGTQLEELLMEAYGPGNSALLIQTITDNRNRTASEVKQILNKNNGKPVGEGGVRWMFQYVGVLKIPKDNVKNIEEFAVNISNGDYKSKIELDKSVGKEFIQIAYTLEYMVDRLNNYKKETEHKIAIQTKKIRTDAINLGHKQEALINVLEDVDQEKQISEKLSNDLEKFKLASDYATDMIFIANPKGVLLYANTATVTITGYTQEYLLNEKNKKTWYELISKKGTIHSIINELTKTKTSTYKEIDILTQEKNKRVLGLKMSPITNNNNEVIFLVGIGRDITKEKEIDKSKSEFVSVASHQLRTPLSTINWYTELLLSKDTGHLSKEQEEYVEEIRKDTKQMNKLVESLLNVSRIDMGTVAIEPEKVNIIKIAESAIKEFRPQMERHKFKFTKNFDAKLPKTMMLDKQLTFMILQNLISNAVKYTPDKGKITINIKRRDKDVEIIVSDSGIGIPKKDQNKIFTKLYRASNAKIKHVTGVGLGLYIIKSFIEKTGGKIWFKSKIKKGTTFYVIIPIKGMKKIKGTKGIV